MKRRTYAILLLIIVAIFAAAHPPTLDVAAQGDDQLGDTTRETIISFIQSNLRYNYVFPDVAEEMNAFIEMRLENGDYDHITSPTVFAQTLTDDLRSISHDLHLRVRYEGDDNPFSVGYTPDAQFMNYNFMRVERLRGNVGYLDLRGFVNVSQSAERTVAGAMAFLANADALIFDLRQNGGGSPDMIQFISSYLFDAEPVHLNSIYDRTTDTTHEYWSLEDIPGQRMPDVPVYVLTSHRTFSGAEEFTYNLQNLERATVVGETTGGGAHPTMSKGLIADFYLSVPFARAINPISGTNWEGTGVIPDVEVPAADALATAHVMALEQLIETSSSRHAAFLEWELAALRAEINPHVPDDSLLAMYAGAYSSDARTGQITLEGSLLRAQIDSLSSGPLTPMAEDVFRLDNFTAGYVRVQFVRDEVGNANALMLTALGGQEERLLREN